MIQINRIHSTLLPATMVQYGRIKHKKQTNNKRKTAAFFTRESPFSFDTRPLCAWCELRVAFHCVDANALRALCSCACCVLLYLPHSQNRGVKARLPPGGRSRQSEHLAWAFDSSLGDASSPFVTSQRPDRAERRRNWSSVVCERVA